MSVSISTPTPTFLVSVLFDTDTDTDILVSGNFDTDTDTNIIWCRYSDTDTDTDTRINGVKERRTEHMCTLFSFSNSNQNQSTSQSQSAVRFTIHDLSCYAVRTRTPACSIAIVCKFSYTTPTHISSETVRRFSTEVSSHSHLVSSPFSLIFSFKNSGSSIIADLMLGNE